MHFIICMTHKPLFHRPHDSYERKDAIVLVVSVRVDTTRPDRDDLPTYRELTNGGGAIFPFVNKQCHFRNKFLTLDKFSSTKLKKKENDIM